MPLTVTPMVTPPGGTLTVSGTEFDRKRPTRLFVDGVQVKQFTMPANGKFKTSVYAPTGPDRTFTVVAKQLRADNVWAQEADVKLLLVAGGTGSGTTPEPPNPPPTPPLAPVISNVVISSVTTSGATITWNTDIASTGVVVYGLDAAYGSTTTATASGTSHSRTLTLLNPGTTYHFAVRATASGLTTTSSDRTFTTTGITPPVPPPVASLYGPAFAADDLNNTRIGYNSVRSSYRFRAEQSSNLNSIRIYIICNGNTGYSNGTGGTIRADLYADDGTSNHFPTGSSLGGGSWTPPSNPISSADQFPVIAISGTPALTFGTLYHIVFTNTDASPTVNYCSVDNTFTFSDEDPHQPKWPDTDMAELIKTGSGPWTVRTGSVNTPIFQLAYSNGSYQGQGYMETWGRGGSDGWNLMNGTIKLREAFTADATSFTEGWVRLARSSGSSPLTVRVETSGGTNVVTGTIPASSINAAAKHVHGSGQRWAVCDFGGTFSLTGGSAYNIVLSTVAGTEYWMTCPRRGPSWGFQPATYFADGYAQRFDGSSWAGIKSLGGTPANISDLQVYLA